MAKTFRELDEDKVRDYKEDIDTLLVFVRIHQSSEHSLSHPVMYRLVFTLRSSQPSLWTRTSCCSAIPRMLACRSLFRFLTNWAASLLAQDLPMQPTFRQRCPQANLPQNEVRCGLTAFGSLRSC